MKLREMIKNALVLVEEYDADSQHLSADPDIQAKMVSVVNHVMFELCRIKRIPKFVEINVKSGQRVTFADIEKACGYEVFQIDSTRGVEHEVRASNTVFIMKADGVFEVECSVYPERIESNTSYDAYEFELSSDVLEIMPYGIAGDLLKSDSSAAYGNIYSQRYENMKRMLDPRYGKGSFKFRGGVAI